MHEDAKQKAIMPLPHEAIQKKASQDMQDDADEAAGASPSGGKRLRSKQPGPSRAPPSKAPKRVKPTANERSTPEKMKQAEKEKKQAQASSSGSKCLQNVFIMSL